MPLVPPMVRRAAALGGALLASACATAAPWQGPAHGGSELVATKEPLSPAGDTLPRQPVLADSGEGPLLRAVSHMVANDGQVTEDAWRPVVAPIPVPGGCTGYGLGAGPLEERGVERDLDGLLGRSTWVFVGLALGGDGVSPLLDAGSCGGGWLDAGTRSRIARLAPEVAGRDTSVLFTTRRAEAPAHSAPGIVGRLVGYLMGQSSSDAPPRTAKPRGAEGGGK